MSRARSLGPLLVAALAAAAPATGQTPVGEVFELVELRPGVHAAVVPPRPAAYAFANSLVVIGADGVLVVDTQQSAAAARALIAEIRRLTALPVRWVVNTHWHGDHVYGNAAYREAFPGVEFIAHESVAADLAERGAARLRQEIAALPATIDARRGWLEEGRGPDGEMLDDGARADIRYSLGLREAYLAGLRELELIGPTRTFDRRLELDVGGRVVRLLHFGPAHTGGDVVVQLPSAGILAVGDLLEHGFPYVADADPVGWADALDAIAALDASVYLPSHGPVTRGGELLEDFRALFRLVVTEARAAAGAGRTPADAAAAATDALASRFERRYGVGRDAFEAGMRDLVDRAWPGEASGDAGS